MKPEAANLKAICAAMDQHARNCGEPLQAILLNPFEVERLGWEEIRGVPVEGDQDIPTGRFRLVCSGIHDASEGVADVEEGTGLQEFEVVEQEKPLYV